VVNVSPISDLLVIIVVQRYRLCCSILAGQTRLLMHQEVKLIENQHGCLHRHLGAIFDGAALFLTCTSLISQYHRFPYQPHGIPTSVGSRNYRELTSMCQSSSMDSSFGNWSLAKKTQSLAKWRRGQSQASMKCHI
jgi:hypothetical protein